MPKDDEQITIALTHYNRFTMLLESIAHVIEDHRIDEIVISDDCSTDGSYGRLLSYFDGHDKVRIFRNEKNLDCYFNKFQAVKRSSNQWVILFDSDNILNRDYLDALYRLPKWDDWTAYLPVWAKPHFDYRRFEGRTVDRNQARALAGNKIFTCALNTANYFFHRENWLKVWDGSVDPHTADSMYQNYNWLKAGGRLVFVPGLYYEHRVHSGSHYQNNWRKTGRFAGEIECALANLR